MILASISWLNRENTSQPIQNKLQWVDVDGERFSVTSGATTGYVADTACESCHSTIFRTYQDVAMSKSFYLPSTDNIIEDFENNHFYHELSNRHYEMELRDGKFVQRRYQIDPDGNPINEIEQTVDFIMGSGTHVRTYLYQNQAGEIYELPLAWYSKTKQWRMNPGYDRPEHQGFTRIVKYQCMFCHNAYPDAPVGSDHYGQPITYPSTLPEGIGCQRCHGPGAEHIETANDDKSTLNEVRDKIINPTQLTPQLRDDVCLQCHLLPIVDPISRVHIHDRGYYSYKPGEPLEDYVFVLDYEEKNPDPGLDRFEINHHPYRLYQSKCYLSSQREMSCMTCHDPHRKIPEDQQTSYYRDRCLTCHQLPDCSVEKMTSSLPQNLNHFQKTNDCVGCHMPPRRTQDVIQVVMTDHFIQKGPPDPRWLDPLKEHSAPPMHPAKPYWPNRTPAESMRSLYLELLKTKRPPDQQLKQIEPLISDTLHTSATNSLHLARLLRLNKNLDQAADTYQSIIRRFPGIVDSYSGLAATRIDSGNFKGSIKPLLQAVSIAPKFPEPHYILGGAYIETGQRKKGIKQWEEVLRLRPNHINVRYDFATVMRWENKLSLAADQYRKILSIEPTEKEAYIELGVILLELEEVDEALRYLKHAVNVIPDDPEIQITFAASLAFGQQYQEAITSAYTAFQSGADRSCMMMISAIARFELGLLDQAIQNVQMSKREKTKSHYPASLHRLLINRIVSIPEN